MSALNDLIKDYGAIEIGIKFLREDGYGETADRMDTELAKLRAELDKCVAWHEGDRSPHAELEQTIAQLREALQGFVDYHETDYDDLPEYTAAITALEATK
jgi:hypothetical protein